MEVNYWIFFKINLQYRFLVILFFLNCKSSGILPYNLSWYPESTFNSFWFNEFLIIPKKWNWDTKYKPPYTTTTRTPPFGLYPLLIFRLKQNINLSLYVQYLNEHHNNFFYHEQPWIKGNNDLLIKTKRKTIICVPRVLINFPNVK